jgi:hypothetical protein
MWEENPEKGGPMSHRLSHQSYQTRPRLNYIRPNNSSSCAICDHPWSGEGGRSTPWLRKLDRQNQIESRTGTFSTTSRIGSNWRLFLPLRALESTSKVRMPPRPSNSCPCQRCSHSLLVTQPRACALQGLKDTSSRAFRVGTLPMKVAYPSNHLSLSSTPSSRLTSAPSLSPLNSPLLPSLPFSPTASPSTILCTLLYT